jgi:DNA-binding beta-propeller fold protein YncE
MANDKDFKVKNGIQPTVYHEGVGTVVSGSEGYSLSSASYDNVSFDVSSQAGYPTSIVFNPDGTKMYVSDDTSNSVYQYTLSTGFDLSTASYASKSLSVSSQDTSPFGLALNNDGTKMYVLGDSSNTVYQYTLSTAYDLSTASYASLSFSVSSQDSVPTEIAFNNDGTKMYIVGASNDSIFQYSLSTAFNVSTASYDNVSFSVSSQDSAPYGFVFNGDGTKMYLFGDTNDNVFQYSLSTAFNLSTASYDSVSFNVSSEDSGGFGIAFNNDGTKLYLAGASNEVLYQYSTVLTTNTLDLSTGSVFEITPTSDIQVGLSNPAASGTVSQATLLLDGGASASYDIANAAYASKSFSVNAQDAIPQNIFLKPDGLTLYVIGSSNDSVYQYSLSVAGDISTASYDSVSFSVTSQEATPQGLFFKPDGTKMYVSGSVSDAVYQYTLSTAWDLSTASYDSVSFSISGANNSIYFKTDGTAFYASNGADDTIYQYTLSTAWDLSTASYASKSFSTATQDSLSYGVTLDSTGNKLYVVGLTTTPRVMQYTLSTAWDISTASYDNLTFTVSEDTAPVKTFFTSDGNKMFVLGTTNDTIYQYSTVTPATITYPSTLEFAGGTAPTSPAIGETDVITFSTTDGGTSYQAVQAIDGAK